MKTLSILFLMVLLACCLNSRESGAQPAEQAKKALSVGEAQPLAMRLANDMTKETKSPDYRGDKITHAMPVGISTNVQRSATFTTNSDPLFGTTVTTNFTDGHWVFTFYARTTHDDYNATVELAADGTTNLVTVERHGGLP